MQTIARAGIGRRGHSAPLTLSDRKRLLLRACAALGVCGLVFHVAHGQLGLGGRGANGFAYNWVYDGVIMGSALACIARAALIREDRLPWLMIGAALAFDALGEIYYTFAFGDSANPPTPSLADALYLLYYPFAYAGLVLLARGRLERLNPSTWLDGAIAAVTAAAVLAAVAFEPIIGAATKGDPAAVATNLAYPVGDLILLALVVGMFALSGWRPGQEWLLLGASMALVSIADTAYLYQSVKGTYVVGGILDSLWIGSALAAGFAAFRPRGSDTTPRFEGRRLMALPGICALTSLAILLYGGFHHVSAIGLAIAAVAVLLVFARGAWTYHENVLLLDSSRRDARTDALTGLGNRRAMSNELERFLANGLDSQPGVLVMFDLDGFKIYNDRFGHIAGDTLLAHLGRQLRESVDGIGEAFRLGGDEFCVLLRCDPSTADRHIAAAVAALCADGEGFSVRTSYGKVDIPAEAHAITMALKIADDRMYDQKGMRRGGAGQQTHDVLLGVMREREPELHHHLCEVGRLAMVVGRRLGMRAEQLDELRRAAELHDVGKAAVPDAILSKPGPLDEHEWAFMRRHTLVGERILTAAPALAPVALIVRSSHERWDGTGYPDGLAGEGIPIGARIVHVCDAFDAMTSDRPYSAAISPDQALAELERGAATQFDPDVVKVFVCAWKEHVSELGSGDQAPGEAVAA